MSRLQKALFLSDKGYTDLKKAIFACTLTNLAMLLPFCVTVMIFSEILTPFVSGGEIQWNHIWLLWGVGIVAAILGQHRTIAEASAVESPIRQETIGFPAHFFARAHNFKPPGRACQPEADSPMRT
ncbi:MAG: hypothetical protein ACLT3G_00195 [Acutalibacteraceae bacterium]